MEPVAVGLGDATLTASGSPLRPGILLDRDGTIIVDHGYVGSINRVEFITGASKAIARFNLAEDGAHIDLFAYCPYHPAGVIEAFTRTSQDRKPRPGMAKAAQAALNLDLSASWVVGDQHEDIGLAEAVGASAVYVGADRCERPGVWSFPSLAAAAPFILERIAV